MTAAKGLKGPAIAVATLVVATFVTLIALSFFIPAAAVREAVKKEIHAVTGLNPTLRGGMSVSLFPHPTVIFRDVLLDGGGNARPAVAAEQLTARLRYFPLLAGRIEIADVTLVRPTINVILSQHGRSNWSGFANSLAHAVEPNLKRTASFSEIAIHDGTVAVYGGDGQYPQRLSEVEFQVAWPAISRSFAANGSFVWNRQAVAASLTLTDFVAALTGQRSGVKLRLSSKSLDIAFDGTASQQQSLKMQGALSVNAPSLRDAMRWTGKGRLPFGGFGRFALRAQSSVEGGTVSLTDVSVELDGNRAEGVLTLATDGHRAVEGTLASDFLDVTPYVSGVRLWATNEQTWDRLPITLDGLADFNLDLRLSAAGVRIAGTQFGRTAVAANMRNGRLNVTIGEAQAFDGLANGSFTLGNVKGGVDVASHLQFSNVDLTDCLGHIFGLRKLEGRGTLALDVDGFGNSVWAVTNTLNGTASLNASAGALAGINVEQLLRRLEKRPLSGNGDYRTGRTPFDRLALSVKIAHGLASVENLQIDGPAVRLAIKGRASVPARDLDLEGKATLLSSAAASAFELPFVVQGPWEDPIVLPDASILIRRSDAAAPLLEAVKRHSAGDAMRSVIDQLFATPSNSPAPVTTSPAAATAPAPPTTPIESR